MFSPELIKAIADDRERAVRDHLRRRQQIRGLELGVRWVRRTTRPQDRRG